ncbi:MAG: acylphosphatase [Syntrophales bacterium]|nr:acylphosphatase [Syntrophales bacterium]
MKKRYHVLISGRVQGVFFRAETQRVAEKLGIKGWVRNTKDGKVEAVFEGEEEKLEEMLTWCRRGPSLARVTEVEVKEEPFSGTFDDFRITY